MGWISELFVHKAVEAAEQLDDLPPPKRRQIYEIAGVDPDLPIDPGAMITDGTFFDLLEFIEKDLEQGRAVPILIGASMRCDDYGAFGLAFKSAPDLLKSYERVERFGKIVTSIANFEVKKSAGSILMAVIPGQGQRLGLARTNELAVAAAMALSREVSDGAFQPVAIHLRGARPADATSYSDHFGCPVHFEAELDAIQLTCETACQPNRLSDAGISAFFDSYLEGELGQVYVRTELERRVLTEVRNALSEGVPTLADVADRLAMSSRTLQRRLADTGLAYQDLVAEARRSLSEHLLQQTDFALAEIAFLTGFSDQSTFTRAFKRWHGQTPARFRRDR